MNDDTITRARAAVARLDAMTATLTTYAVIPHGAARALLALAGAVASYVEDGGTGGYGECQCCLTEDASRVNSHVDCCYGRDIDAALADIAALAGDADAGEVGDA